MLRFVHWRTLFRRRKFEDGMVDEFAFHLQARTEDLIGSGMAPREAERRARLEFGGRQRYSAECRESHRVHWLDEITRNLTYALRSLRKAPLFSLAEIIPLAIGLAAVGVTFAVVNTVLLRPLPFAESNRIVTISQKVPFLSSSPTVVTAGEFQRWQQSGLFDLVALIDAAAYTLQNHDRPERIYGAIVTPDFFRVFDLKPIVGRGLSAADAIEGSSNVVVISQQLWVRHFGSARNVVGTTIYLSGMPMTVIGVMPAGFEFPRLAEVSSVMNWAPEQAEFWTPLVITPKIVEDGNLNYYAVGRLRKGVTFTRAASQLLAMAVHLFKQQELKYPHYKSMIEQLLGALVIYVTPLRDTMAGGVRDVLWMLMAAVALLLALVLFNLGNLLLTRNAHKQREYIVRQTLGASRWQLFRQSFFEQTILVGLALAGAAALMAGGIQIVRAMAADKLPRLSELGFSFMDFVVLLAAAFFTAMLFGALPQVLISERVFTFGLNSQGRTSTSDRHSNRLRFVLMAAEIAFSLALLVAAGLLVRSFRNVMQVQPGFNPQNVLTVKVPFNPQKTDKPEKRLQHIHELIERLDSLPGVTSASLVNRLPLTGDSEIHNVRAVGRPLPQQAESISAEYRVIDAAYFRTMQIPLLAGREFRADDPVAFALINRKMALRLWPGENAIGKQFTDGDNPPVKVIGVVGDVHNGSLEKSEMMQFYRLITAAPYYADTIVIRANYEPERLIPAVQKAIAQLDASEPLTHAQTMQHLLEEVTLQRRFVAGLLSSFAVVAVFLSAIGLFSVASLSAARRTREFAIRFAIGATGGEILRLELMRTATVALVLIVTALLAGWFPARRAARIDPAEALRIE